MSITAEADRGAHKIGDFLKAAGSARGTRTPSR